MLFKTADDFFNFSHLFVCADSDANEWLIQTDVAQTAAMADDNIIVFKIINKSWS